MRSLFFVFIAVASMAFSHKTVFDRKHIISDDILSTEAECQVQVKKRKYLVPYDDIFDFKEIIADRKIFSFKCSSVLDYVKSEDDAIGLLRRLRDEDWVLRFSYSTERYYIEAHEAPVTDPMFSEQWNLDAVDSLTFFKGWAVDYVDINVYDVWKSGIKGAGSSVIVLDTGIEWNNTEFDSDTRFIPEQSYSYMGNGTIAEPGDIYPTTPNMHHGTATTSLIIASMNNNVCMTGVSPESKWAGRYIVSSESKFPNKSAHAVSAGVEGFQVSSNSWGYNTTNLSCVSRYLATQTSTADALELGAKTGNNGLGITYVFSSGNDGDCGAGTQNGPNCRDPNTICIGAVTSGGTKAEYSSYGSGVFVVAPAGGDTKWGTSIETITMKRSDSCSKYSRGTSFSCPLVSGVVLLMQSATGNKLRKRDVATILASTATPIDDCSSGNQRSTCVYGGWHRNQAGYRFSNYYGFGLVNAAKAVEMAKNWSNIEIPFDTDGQEVAKVSDPLPSEVPVNGGKSIFNNMWVFKLKIQEVCLEVDAVYVLFHWCGTNSIDMNTPAFSELVVDVISPSGTRSRVTTNLVASEQTRTEKEIKSSMIPEYVKTYAFWHENSCGTWTIEATYPDCSQKENTCGKQVVDAYGIKFDGTPNPVRMMYDGCNKDSTAECVEPEMVEGGTMLLSWTTDPKDIEVQTKEMSFALVFHLNNNIISYELGKAQVSGKRFSFVIPSIRELGGVPQNTFVCASRETPNNCVHLLDVGALEEVVPNNGNYNLIKISYKLGDVSLQSMNESEVFNTKIVSPNRGGIIHQSITNFIKWTVNEGGKAVCGDVVSDRVWVEMCIWRRGEDSCLQKFSKEVAASDKQVELSAIEYAGLTSVTLGCIDGGGNKLESWDSVEAACSPDKIWFDNINVTLADGSSFTSVESHKALAVTFDYDPSMANKATEILVAFVCKDTPTAPEIVAMTTSRRSLVGMRSGNTVFTPIGMEGKCRVMVSNGLYGKTSDEFNLIPRETVSAKHIKNLSGQKLDISLERASDLEGATVSVLVFDVSKGYSKLPDIYSLGTTTTDTYQLYSSAFPTNENFRAAACVSPIDCGEEVDCATVVFSSCNLSNEFSIKASANIGVGGIAGIVVSVVVVVGLVVGFAVGCTKRRKIHKETRELVPPPPDTTNPGATMDETTHTDQGSAQNIEQAEVA